MFVVRDHAGTLDVYATSSGQAAIDKTKTNKRNNKGIG